MLDAETLDKAGRWFTEAAEHISAATAERDREVMDARFALGLLLQQRAMSLFPDGVKIPVLYTPEIPGYTVLNRPTIGYIIQPDGDLFGRRLDFHNPHPDDEAGQHCAAADSFAGDNRN